MEKEFDQGFLLQLQICGHLLLQMEACRVEGDVIVVVTVIIKFSYLVVQGERLQ